MKKKLYGEQVTPPGHRAKKTKVVSPSGQSHAPIKDSETEEEGSHYTGNTSSMKGRRHPFIDDILSVELPINWKGLNIDRYASPTDPNKYIDVCVTQMSLYVCVTQMSLYTTDEVVLCRVFPNSLKGMTLSWFTRFPPLLVDCFKTLVGLFSTQFATRKPHHLTSLTLVKIKQEKGESLRMFMERFSKFALQIRDLNLEVALHHMLTALRLGPFADSLCKKPAIGLDELRRRAAKFVLLEELREFRNEVRADSQPEKMRTKDKPTPSHQFAKPKEIRMPRFLHYTPLNANRSKILEEALHADLMPTPRRVATPRNADTNKYCRLYQNYGHSTEECVALKDKIKELIQVGHKK